MTNRELLEKAARAAGVPILGYNERLQAFETRDPNPLNIHEFPIYWRPLTDDSDALQLARSLLMRVDFYKREIWYPVGGGRWQTISWHLEAYKGAIVSAAAAMCH